MIYLFIVVFLVYLALLMVATRTWNKIPFHEAENFQLFASVIIAVRDEAGNILALLQDLNRQTYPWDRFEVIIVNDGSSDGTVQIIEQFIPLSKFSLQVLTLKDQFAHFRSSKKRALAYGIGQAKGELILTTDGDCRLSTGWIAAHAGIHSTGQVFFVSGPVSFKPDHLLFYKLQQMEFLAIQVLSAILIHHRHPSMCNGANLSFKKEIYHSVNGYEGYGQVISGDDEFLMHKIHQKYPGKTDYLKNRNAMVVTAPQISLKDLVHQRIRWAAKWKYHRNFQNTGLALLIFLTYLSLIAAILLSTYKYYFIFTVLSISLKFLLEYIFLRKAFLFFGKRFHHIHFLILEITYPFYALFFGLMSLKGNYRWKGRKYYNQ